MCAAAPDSEPPEVRIMPPARDSVRIGAIVRLECLVVRGAKVRLEWRRPYSKSILEVHQPAGGGSLVHIINHFSENHTGIRFELRTRTVQSRPDSFSESIGSA